MSDATQSAFADGLLNAAPPPAGVTAWNSPSPSRRYAVYRNNVAASLTGALAARFPAAERIAGAAFFRAMAGAFISLHPPRSPLLLAYAPLDPQALASVGPDRLGDLVLIPHPSLSVVSSPHPAVTIWAMNAGETRIAPVPDWRGKTRSWSAPE